MAYGRSLVSESMPTRLAADVEEVDPRLRWRRFDGGSRAR